MIAQQHRRISSGTLAAPVTTNFFSATVHVRQIVFYVSDPGTNWVCRIQDKGSTPAILAQRDVIAMTEPVITTFGDNEVLRGVRMADGVDIVSTTSSGSDVGVVDVWITAEDK